MNDVLGIPQTPLCRSDLARDAVSVSKGEAARLGSVRITHDRESEARIHSSSLAIDGEMRADSMGLFFLASC
jgi:hypothetical protein